MRDKDVKRQATAGVKESDIHFPLKDVGQGGLRHLPAPGTTSKEVPEDLCCLAWQVRSCLRNPAVRKYVHEQYQEWMAVVDLAYDVRLTHDQVGPQGEGLRLDPIAMKDGPFKVHELAAILAILHDRAFPRSDQRFQARAEVRERSEIFDEEGNYLGETKEELRSLHRAFAHEILWESMKSYRDYRSELEEFIVRLASSEVLPQKGNEATACGPVRTEDVCQVGAEELASDTNEVSPQQGAEIDEKQVEALAGMLERLHETKQMMLEILIPCSARKAVQACQIAQELKKKHNRIQAATVRKYICSLRRSFEEVLGLGQVMIRSAKNGYWLDNPQLMSAAFTRLEAQAISAAT